MNMTTCPSCKAFVQPEWDRCKICGADATGATLPPPASGAAQTPGSGPPSGPSGFRGAPPGSGPQTDAPPVAAIVGIVVALLALAVGGWWLMSGSSDDDDEQMVTATLPGPTEPEATTTSVDDGLVADGFAAIMTGAIRASGSTVEDGCVRSVVSKPEHAEIARDVMSGDAVAEDPRGHAVFTQIVVECIGVGNFSADVFTAEWGISRPSAECFGRVVEADPLLTEAMLAGRTITPSPEVTASVALCLTPAELEMLAAGR